MSPATKPDLAVYQHFLERAGSSPTGTWLVSGNAFDILGAASAGWRTAWVRCDARAVFDPWGVEPTVTVTRLEELDRAIP